MSKKLLNQSDINTIFNAKDIIKGKEYLFIEKMLTEYPMESIKIINNLFTHLKLNGMDVSREMLNEWNNALNKIEAIKAIRLATNSGLREAKDFCEEHLPNFKLSS